MTDPEKIRRALTELRPEGNVILRLADGRERRGIYHGFDGNWVHLGDERIAVAEVEGVLLEVTTEGPE